MHSRRLRLPRAGLTAVTVSSLALIGAGTAAATPTVSVVSRGLNAPRHLTFGPGGHLYFAIAGADRETEPDCASGTDPQGTPARFCPGPSGAVDEILSSGRTSTLLRGLPSEQETNTGAVTGVDALLFDGENPVVLTGNLQSDLTGAPSSAGPASAGVLLGRRPIRVRVSYEVRVDGHRVRRYRLETEHPLESIADLSGFAASHPQSPASVGGPPGSTLYNSDPSDVVAYRGGYAVTDAGADDVLLVTSSGRTSIAARLPTLAETAAAGSLGAGSPAQTIDAQAAASSLSVGPDGALYVGVSRGFPGLPGTAAVYRVVPGEAPVPVVTGLSSVSDLAFTRAGNLLILESSTRGGLGSASASGALLRATLNPTAPVTATDLDVPGLVDPDGLAISSRGNVYVSNHAIGNATGQILKITGLNYPPPRATTR